MNSSTNELPESGIQPPPDQFSIDFQNTTIESEISLKEDVLDDARAVLTQNEDGEARNSQFFEEDLNESAYLDNFAVKNTNLLRVPTSRGVKKYFSRLLPIVQWLPSYLKKDKLKTDGQSDLVAAITVAIMVLPQGLAYATLASLPPIYGLYACIIPTITYALLGTSRQLAVGPVAITSQLVASALDSISTTMPISTRVVDALYLCVAAGVVQTVMGLLRLGFIVNFLSGSVVEGFTAASSIIIALSQFKALFGIKLTRSNYIHVIVQDLIKNLPNTHWPTFVFSVVCILCFHYLPKIKFVQRNQKFIPIPLIIITLCTLASYIGKLNERGIGVVGKVPAGFPTPILESPPAEHLTDLWINAVTIGILSFIESIAIAGNLATKHKYIVDTNQELIALGMAKVIGGIFQAYPVTGGFSRTAVANQAGAKTPMYGLLVGCIVAIAVVTITPAFYYIPNCTLAALIIVAVSKLIVYEKVNKIYQTSKRDFLHYLTCFICTLFLGVGYGLLAALGISILLVIEQSAQPHFAVLGRMGQTQHYRNIKRYREAQTTPGVLVLRFDSSLFFFNSSYFKNVILGHVMRSRAPVKFVVLDASSISRLDLSGVEALSQVRTELKAMKVTMLFASVHGPVRDFFKISGMGDIADPSNHLLFMDTHEAVMHAAESMGMNQKEMEQKSS